MLYLPLSVGSVDFNEALTTEEDEQNLNKSEINNEPLWTIIEGERKKRKVPLTPSLLEP